MAQKGAGLARTWSTQGAAVASTAGQSSLTLAAKACTTGISSR